jgi:hypothetical protein
MKNVIEALYFLSNSSVQFAEVLTHYSLVYSKEVAIGTLQLTGGLLHALSWVFFFIEGWRDGLLVAGENVESSREKVEMTMLSSIEKVQKGFEQSKLSLDTARDFAVKFIYDNRVISSIMGSAHNETYLFSDIQMSFRELGRDVTVEQFWTDYQNSGCKEIVLLVPGLFCDETLWEDKSETLEDGTSIFYSGLANIFRSKGIFPVSIRFNHGKHIPSNGKDLLLLIDKLYQKYDGKLNILAYSLGSLVTRSFLYYAKRENKPWLKNISSTLLISSPDGGSYLEKVGFWFGFLMESAPVLAFKLIGMIGNLRSDGIKDLSHGIIREEDWRESTQIRRYIRKKYFGELDEIDAYQIYSIFSDKDDSFSEILGDGIIEKDSLEFLKKEVYLKKENPDLRSVLVKKRSHFSIMNAPELFEIVERIW